MYEIHPELLSQQRKIIDTHTAAQDRYSLGDKPGMNYSNRNISIIPHGNTRLALNPVMVMLNLHRDIFICKKEKKRVNKQIKSIT